MRATKKYFLLLGVLTAAAWLSAQPPLLQYNCRPVTTVADWDTLRRPQVQQLVLSHIYGHMPPAPQWQAQVVKQQTLHNGKAIYKEVALRLYHNGLPTCTIRLALFVPVLSTPAPVVLGLNKCGNAAVCPLPEVGLYTDRTLHPACEKIAEKGDGSESLRGCQTAFWCVDSILQRGYAFATFHESDIAADVPTLQQGIFTHYPEWQSNNGWGVISAWAWGLQRAVDYLITDSLMDARRIILYGHSRRGKAALLAAALDTRVAMVVPHQSGTGGMALGRHGPLESIARINKAFPHWFCINFKQYGKHPRRLPIDQHFVTALVAPRPLLETTGTLDVWSSFWLSRRNMKLASSVYNLYGVPGLLGNGKLSKRKQFNHRPTGNLLQVRRPYGHTMNADYWNYIFDYADLKLGQSK